MIYHPYKTQHCDNLGDLTAEFHKINDANYLTVQTSRLLLDPQERLLYDQCGDFRVKIWRDAYKQETGHDSIEVAAKKKKSKEEKAERENISAKKKETEKICGD